MPVNLDEMFDAIVHTCLTAAAIGVLVFALAMAAVCLLAWLWDRLAAEDSRPEAGQSECAVNPAVEPDDGGTK